MIATTTEIVNGRKHTITKIIDANGTRIIEDYGDGRKRVTLNGKEEISPTTRPFTSGITDQDIDLYKINSCYFTS